MIDSATLRGLEKDRLQALLSHQVPDGDPTEILDPALDALLVEARKQKAALTDKPRRVSTKKKPNRGIPARVRREVFERDEGRCTYVDERGRRCASKAHRATTPEARRRLLRFSSRPSCS